MQPRTLFIRRSDRRPIVLPARCRSRTGFVNHVVITDLSAEGCRIESRGLTLVEDDLVTLRPEGLESLVGVIRWRGNRQAGVEFDQPLYQPVVDHLAQLHANFLAPLSAAGAMPLHRAA